MNIREILRTAHVTRWHTVRTHRQQNLAEHHYLVTMIARDMARIIGMTDPEMLQMLTDWCMVHDTPEVLTGDVLPPTKLMIKKYIDISVIEDQTSTAYARLRASVHASPVGGVAKLADLMESIVFLHNEGVRVDDPRTHAHHVLNGLLIAYRTEVKANQEWMPVFEWHRLYDYREELNESPVRELWGLSHGTAPNKV